LEDGMQNIRIREGESPFVVATDARGQQENMLSFSDVQGLLREKRVVLLLFGTAWGLDRDFLQQADGVLEPIRGIDGYNHLPVRAAAAIIVDRLVGVHP
ncbi:MAG: RNA methyltransferase, partial [Deltaproteobacteria bacterium]